MNARWRIGVGLAAAMAIGVAPGLGLAARSGHRPGPAAVSVIEAYVRSPVLVRAGERVRLPVRVVCATAHGDPCPSAVTVGTRSSGAEPWQLTPAGGLSDPEFDLSSPARRATGMGRSGAVDYFVGVSAAGGRAITLPQRGSAAPMRFFVTKDLRVTRVPAVPFGRVRPGRTVLFLPWGSTVRRAGLQLGRETATLAPSSFDVDRAGRIYLADTLGDRVDVFSRGRFVRTIAVKLGPRADIAVGRRGALFVMDAEGSGVVVRAVEVDGRRATVELGRGIPGQIAPQGNGALVDLLPEDRWVSVTASGLGARVSSQPTTGRPIRGGELLRVIQEHALRLGTASGDRVLDATELRFSQTLGEVAVAQPDGSGGYWAVVHVSRTGPRPADQYQVVHYANDRVVRTFAVGDARYANTPPMARFRLRAGVLYQLMTFPDGLRIVRYQMGGES